MLGPVLINAEERSKAKTYRTTFLSILGKSFEKLKSKRSFSGLSVRVWFIWQF